MAKRQLSRRQSWRIEKIQEERSARAAKRESRALEELQGGALALALDMLHFSDEVTKAP